MLLKRWFFVLLIMFAFAVPASAKVNIRIDLSAQQMTVHVDGVRKYTWPVSTGRKLSWTRTGTFRVQGMRPMHYSSIYDNAPMPHSIFYDGNRAIHGTNEENRLGSRASHGCVRLSQANARTLFKLVTAYGEKATIKVVH